MKRSHPNRPSLDEIFQSHPESKQWLDSLPDSEQEAIISFRVSVTQKTQLQTWCKAKQISLSAWIKSKLFDTPLPQVRRSRIPEANHQMKQELHRIGVNLNQITRSLHLSSFSEYPDITALSQTIADLQYTLHQVQLQLAGQDITQDEAEPDLQSNSGEA